MIERISNRSVPTGASTSKVSPSVLPMMARPKGASSENAQVHRIGLLGADDLVDVLIPGVQVLDADTAAQADVARLLIRFFNDNGVGQDILHLGDAAIELGLLVFASSYSLFSERSPKGAGLP